MDMTLAAAPRPIVLRVVLSDVCFRHPECAVVVDA